MPPKSSPASAPEYSLHREGITAVDVMSNVVKKHGCNTYMYRYAHIQVVPESGANPDVAIWWWCDYANSGNGAFIQEHVAIAKSGVGVNTPYEFTIEPRGRIFFVQIVTIASGSVDVFVSGFERHQFS